VIQIMKWKESSAAFVGIQYLYDNLSDSLTEHFL